MAWATIRPVTDEDMERLNAAAVRFEQRHGIHPDHLMRNTDEWNSKQKRMMDCTEVNYLIRLWDRCVARALREKGAEGVAWGYVGYHVD